MRGLVSRLLKQSFVDGPGNRAVVFLQGCQLSCLYCHNPQTQAVCIGCGICIEGCPGGALSPGVPLRWEADLCQGCDRCIAVCPHLADPRAITYSIDELMKWLRPLRPFLSGVTVSGGEPLLQAEFVGAFCAQARTLGLTAMIETNAALPVDPLLPHIDGALVDLKVWDEDLHRQLTGEGNAVVKANLELLARAGKLTELRIPIIPGFSDTDANVAAVCAFAAALDPRIPVKLQRFRTHGTRGPAAGWQSPSDAGMARALEIARASGLVNVSQSR
ncbi:MAG TPA: YjjW family glycine radical enzyme activase [Symbiobacteriaceae bacterium]|nr:YjjW family glycine radical enzyme activase [Symbiobacteriaceae bacterium]